MLWPTFDTQTDMDDLVQRAARDAEALGRLYDLYYERIFKFCVHRLFAKTPPKR